MATVQIDCEPLQAEANMQRVLPLIRDAKRSGAELVVLPHMFTTGYNVFLHPSRVAESMNGPTLSFLKTVARKMKIHIVGGFIERSNGEFFDTTVVVNTKGEIVGSYRRMSLWMDEMNDLSRGEELCIVDLPIGRAGLLVSRDLTIPEMARSLAFEGVEILLICGALDDHAYWEVFCRSRALENACFVVAANRVGIEKGLCYCGHSMVVDPEGCVLSDSESREEARVAELDPGTMEDERTNYWQIVELEECFGLEQGEYLSEPVRCRPMIPVKAISGTKKPKKKSRPTK